MYTPQHFQVTDICEMLAFIRANAFGQLISTVEGRLFSSHLPFFLGNDGQTLICHVSKQNPQWKSIEDQEVLVTFQGPHDYISPSWYSSPGVPTWNYQSVHVYGTSTLITEKDELKSIVNELAGVYESTREEPWDPKYKDSLLNAIVGIKVEISEIQGKYKLSQNRSEKDQRQVIVQLQKNGSIELSQAMENEL